ncbi:peptidoglycan-binding protein [Candidatus Nomurabacteria bacterium]|nr:peptidoglycan-binding protein [Candidatus Nomurabacteria bacterium]
MDSGSTIVNNTFDACGSLKLQPETNTIMIITGNIFKNSSIQIPGETAAINIEISATTVVGTGTRLFARNSLDGAIGSLESGSQSALGDFTIQDNYVADWRGMSSRGWASNTNNLLRFVSLSLSGGGPNATPTADLSYDYFFQDVPISNNAHVLTNVPNTFTLSNSVFGSSGVGVVDSGDWSGILTQSGIHTISSGLFLCNAAGVGGSIIANFLPPGGYVNGTGVALSNTFCGGDTSGGIDTNETSSTPSGVVTMRNNLFYALSPSLSTKMASRGATPLQDPCTTPNSSTSNCDYNGAYNYAATQTLCVGCTNQGRGYAGKWSFTPGYHDQDGFAPNFLDSGVMSNHSRKIENFDQKYLGFAAATAWDAAGSYAFGDIVSNAVTLMYNNELLNYRCINPMGCTGAEAPGVNYATRTASGTTTSQTIDITSMHLSSLDYSKLSCGQTIISSFTTNGSPITSVTFNYPSSNNLTCYVGSTWRNNWEWASLYQIRQAIYNQTIYQPDSQNGLASASTAVPTLISWIKKGYTPTNVAYRKTGLAGTDIGVTSVIDLTPPAVSITSPAPSTISGTVSIAATSTDDFDIAAEGVQGVKFYYDDLSHQIGTEDTTSPYSASLDTLTLSQAAHTIFAVSRDLAGNTTTSTAVNVTVSNGPPPVYGSGGLVTNYVPLVTTPVIITPTPVTTVTPVTTPITTPNPLLNQGGGEPSPLNSSSLDKGRLGGVVFDLGTQTLKPNTTGDSVKELQKLLNQALNLNLTVDGKLGPKTITVVKKWQKNHGLVADGIVGPKTKALMKKLVK